jgi:hypothetical protein
METMTDLERIAGIKLQNKSGKLHYGGSLDLSGTGITSLPDNLTVGGSLNLRDTSITSLPDNLTVGGSLNLRDTSITSLPDNLTVGGSLDLGGTGITSLPDNLTVGGSIYLRDTSITSLPDNLTVGGFLDLGGTGITSLPDNLTVGGSLYLRGTGITDTSNVNKNEPSLLQWRNGKYLKIDGIFSDVISHRGKVWTVKNIGSDKHIYIVTDGHGRYAHGETVKAAKEDLIYKLSNRDKTKYQGMNPTTTLSFADSIECYRVITGACGEGVRSFVEQTGAKKRGYSIAEIIELTKGQYGHYTFKRFFSVQ